MSEHGVFFDLFSAWKMWINGIKIQEDYIIFGISALWWNRIGQLSQFLGGCIVIFEIIGKEPAKQIGEKFLENRILSFLFIFFTNKYKVAKISSLMIFAELNISHVYMERHEDFKNSFNNWFENGLIEYMPTWIGHGTSMVINLIVTVFIIYLINSGIVVSIYALFSHIATQEDSDIIFKQIGLSLLLFGFHFTLLCS